MDRKYVLVTASHDLGLIRVGRFKLNYILEFKMKFLSITLAVLSTVSLFACQKEADHIADEANKTTTQAQMAGQWTSACSQKGLLWAAAGIKSEKMVYNFYSNTGKTSMLFSDDNCQNEVGQATYSGTATIGAPSAVDSSNLLDLNYLSVSITITNQDTVHLLNNPLTPACGINDWAINAARDVTSAAGGANCPIAKPSQVFDIIKTDGQTLHFGLADAAHDKSTQAARPVQLDLSNGFSKK
jgi:hypothetical protein